MKSLAALVLSAQVVFAATTDTITQWGITFTFQSAVEYGTFVNGDYWVVAPVTVTAMDPDWSNGTNGWEVNPLVQLDQGFWDSVTYAYDADLRVAMPFTITTNASVVKTIGGVNASSDSMIISAAVLTVLESTPTGDGAEVFRPPYVGTNKPLYSLSDLRTDLLPSFADPGSSPTLATVSNNFSKCLRMDHHSNFARVFRPSAALKDYQPENTQEINDAMLRLMLNDDLSDKMPALVMFTQHALDHAYAIHNGYRLLDKGHNPNHRIIAAWGATMLDIGEIKTSMQSGDFHEDAYLYVGSGSGIPLWGEVGTELAYWNYIMGLGGSRSTRDPYGYIDGGRVTGTAEYQTITSQSIKGTALIARLFPELQDCFATGKFDIVSAYAERWVTNGSWRLPDPAAPYDGNTGNYGVTFGPDGSGGYIAGDGRAVANHGADADAGQYKSTFVAAMWDAYSGWTPSPPGNATRRMTATTVNAGTVKVGP